MHVGVVATVVVGDAVDDGARLLRARRRIEKNQTGIVLKDGKVATYRLGVETSATLASGNR